MLSIEPISLSRQLERADDEATEWHERLTELALPEDLPLQPLRTLLSQDTHDEIRETLPEGDPLRPHLLRWQAHLLEQRVNASMVVESAALYHHTTHKLLEPERVELSLDGIKRRLITDVRRKEWLPQLTRLGSGYSSAQQLLWQRRVEVYRRLKGQTLDEAELPTNEAYTIARWVLERTQTLVERQPGLLTSIERSLQSPALTFPTHLGATAFVDWFRETRLLEEPNLRSFVWPKPYAASSFGIALERFGAELFRSFASRSQPFVIAYDPLRLQEFTAGWLFASLLTKGSFQQRHLGGARATARAVKRAWGNILLHEVRLRAVRVLVREALQMLSRERLKAFEALTELAFGEPLSPNLLAVLPKVNAHDAQRLCAIGLAHVLDQEFTQRHDEDWFRNPRAEEELRSMASKPPPIVAEAELVKLGLGRFIEELEQKL